MDLLQLVMMATPAPGLMMSQLGLVVAPALVLLLALVLLVLVLLVPLCLHHIQELASRSPPRTSLCSHSMLFECGWTPWSHHPRRHSSWFAALCRSQATVLVLTLLRRTSDQRH